MIPSHLPTKAKGFHQMHPQSDQHTASRVVVVNDDSTQLGILASILEKSGFAVQVYTDAEQALRAMHDQAPPDVIITDLYMPGIDGWRFCRLLRSSEFKTLNDVPIIVVSATFSGAEATLITSELGAAAFLPSPVQADQFITQVRMVLQGQVSTTLPRVLIVDDSKSLANALREVFESHAYTADVALTGQEALAAFKASHYDLAVLDYHLPDIMGSALLQAFVLERPATVCVMITTNTQPKLALEWMQSGAAAYVRKPFDPDYLVHVCDGARRERALLRVEDLLEQRTKELRESEALQRTLLHNLPAGMVIVDAATRVIEQVNDHVSLMFGASVDHLIGRQCHALLCPADKGACPVCDLGQTLDHSEREMLREDGTRLPILKTVQKIQLDGQDKLLECFTDLSLQKRIEEDLRKSENRYRRLINNLPDIVYIYSDLRGGLFWSPSVETVLGYTVEHLHANPFLWNESIHPEDKEKVTMTIIESSRGKPFEIEYRIQDARGDWRWLHDRSTGRITRDGETLIEGIATDVTKRKIVEEQLNKRTQELESIFSSAKTVSLIKTNLDGVVEEFSSGAEDIFGYDRVEMIGRHVGVLHPLEEANRLPEFVARLLQGKGFTLETRLVRKSGQEFPALFSAQPIFDDQCQVVSTLGISFDITDRKRAEEELHLERKRLAGIIKGTNAGTWEWNVQTGETVFNERWAEIIGYTLEEISPMSIETWMKFAHPDDLKISKELLEKHFKGQSDYYELESRMRHKNGDWVWVKDRGRVATWAEDGKPLMMLGTHLDITARKAAEKEIGDINEQLRKSNAEKDMLFSIIAHDLKSPMSGLVASSDMLVNEFEGLSRKDCQTLFASMRNSAGNVMTLLDDLLQWSLMSQGGMDYAPAPCSLDELVDASLATTQDMAKRKEILIRGDIPHDAGVLVDQPMINTVFRNILFNAIKFTPRGGEISITAWQEGPSITVAVQDNGMGMDEQTMATIFSIQNKRRHVGTEGEQGTGLGLILCRQFIKRHGGQIWMESKPSQGTTVFFTLPTQEIKTPPNVYS
jgi:PAS domain S-box-containing protein